MEREPYNSRVVAQEPDSSRVMAQEPYSSRFMAQELGLCRPMILEVLRDSQLQPNTLSACFQTMVCVRTPII